MMSLAVPVARSRSLARLLGTTAFRITALIVAAFMVTAAIVVGALFWQTNSLLTAQVLRSVSLERQSLIEAAQAGGTVALIETVAGRSGVPKPGATLLLLLDAAGHKLSGNLSVWPSEIANRGQGATFTYATDRPAVGMPTVFPDGSRLLVGRDLTDQSTLIDRIRRLFLLGFGLLSLTGLAGGLMASRLMLTRITEITDTSSTIMGGDLSRRVPLSGSDDEFDHLASNLNAMLERIEQLVAAMREVSDNIAHDLKTPLSRLRSRAEAAMRDPTDTAAHADGLARVIDDADAIIQTFNALLLIARLEAGAVDNSAETFDLNQLLGDVAELYEPVADEAGQRLTRLPGEPALISANRQLIGQALANLIDNAIKYGMPLASGEGEITVGLDVTANAVRIVVGDRGPGIPAADRARVARRFVRLDQSRTKPGTGLGLSLVAAVARLHAGTMQLEDNGPGLRVVLALPVSLLRNAEVGL